MPAPTNRLVYLESRPSPAQRPTTSHQLALPDSCSSASAQNDRPQNKTDGVSGVMTMPPTASNGIANANQTARSATTSPNKICANRQSARKPTRGASTAQSLIPNGLSPATNRPAAIIHAAMGG